MKGGADMKKGSLIVMAIFLTFLFTIAISGNGFAYMIGASYTWDASTPSYNASATLHPGTIDLSTLTMGDFLGRNASTPNASTYGDSGVSVGWDDTWVGSVGHANTNGDALDGQADGAQSGLGPLRCHHGHDGHRHRFGDFLHHRIDGLSLTPPCAPPGRMVGRWSADPGGCVDLC